MQSMLHADEEKGSSKLAAQALQFLMHVLLALGSWLALMLLGYMLSPANLPQLIILVLSLLVPMLVGHLVTRFRQDQTASLIWMVGLIWILIVSLWVLDMP